MIWLHILCIGLLGAGFAVSSRLPNPGIAHRPARRIFVGGALAAFVALVSLAWVPELSRGSCVLGKPTWCLWGIELSVLLSGPLLAFLSGIALGFIGRAHRVHEFLITRTASLTPLPSKADSENAQTFSWGEKSLESCRNAYRATLLASAVLAALYIDVPLRPLEDRAITDLQLLGRQLKEARRNLGGKYVHDQAAIACLYDRKTNELLEPGLFWDQRLDETTIKMEQLVAPLPQGLEFFVIDTEQINAKILRKYEKFRGAPVYPLDGAPFIFDDVRKHLESFRCAGRREDQKVTIQFTGQLRIKRWCEDVGGGTDECRQLALEMARDGLTPLPKGGYPAFDPRPSLDHIFSKVRSSPFYSDYRDRTLEEAKVYLHEQRRRGLEARIATPQGPFGIPLPRAELGLLIIAAGCLYAAAQCGQLRKSLLAGRLGIEEIRNFPWLPLMEGQGPRSLQTGTIGLLCMACITTHRYAEKLRLEDFDQESSLTFAALLEHVSTPADILENGFLLVGLASVLVLAGTLRRLRVVLTNSKHED